MVSKMRDPTNGKRPKPAAPVDILAGALNKRRKISREERTATPPDTKLKRPREIKCRSRSTDCDPKNDRERQTNSSVLRDCLRSEAFDVLLLAMVIVGFLALALVSIAIGERARRNNTKDSHSASTNRTRRHRKKDPFETKPMAAKVPSGEHQPRHHHDDNNVVEATTTPWRECGECKEIEITL